MLEMAGKLWPFQTQGGGFKKKKKNPHTGFRKILPYVYQRQKFQFIKEKEICRGPWQWVLPSMAGGGKQSKELPHPPPNPTHPLWTAGLSGRQQLSVWQEKDVEKGASLQRRSCSGLTAGRLSCGKVGCLKTPPRRRGAAGKDWRTRNPTHQLQVDNCFKQITVYLTTLNLKLHRGKQGNKTYQSNTDT